MPKINLFHIGVVLAVAVAIASYWLYPSHGDALVQSVEAPTGVPAVTAKTFTSSQYGISFPYPGYYDLTSKVLSVGAPVHDQIVLRDRFASSAVITIDIFENDFQYSSAADFAYKNPESNIGLLNGSIDTMIVGGISALKYDWRSVYDGESVVAERQGYVYLFTVVGGAEDPALGADFVRIVNAADISAI